MKRTPHKAVPINLVCTTSFGVLSSRFRSSCCTTDHGESTAHTRSLPVFLLHTHPRLQPPCAPGVSPLRGSSFFLLALSPVMKRKTPHKAVPRRQNDARTQTSHLFTSETASACSGDNPVPGDSVSRFTPGRWYASGWPSSCTGKSLRNESTNDRASTRDKATNLRAHKP